MRKAIIIALTIILIASCGPKNNLSKSNQSKSENKRSIEQTQSRELTSDFQIHLGRQDYAVAIDKLNELIALNSNNPDYSIYRYKGMVLQVMGKKEEANKVYNSIINGSASTLKEKERARQLMAINNKVAEPAVTDTEIKRNTDSIPSTEAFQVIEEAPIFPGCETQPIAARNKCMSRGVAKHIMRTIDVDIAQVTNYTGFIRSYVTYKIDTTGTISDIKARGKNKFLNLEAHRVMAQLPQVTPGMQKGKKVAVPYTIPIRFAVD